MLATINMLNALRRAAEIKVGRNFTAFFADRLIRAFGRQTLVDAVEELAQTMDCNMGAVPGDTLAAFVQEASGPQGQAILIWCREHPKLAAMLASINDHDQRVEAVKSIELPEVATSDLSHFALEPTYDISIEVECLTPLAHGSDAKAGNATLFRRCAVITQTGRYLYLPIYSGNALRGQMRDLLADHFLRSIGLSCSRTDPVLDLWAFHMLYAGGMLNTGSKAINALLGKNGTVRCDGVRELRSMIIPLSLLGTAIGNQVISGHINVGHLRPRCKEWGNGERPASELIGWEFLTRREDYEGRNSEDDTTAMIAETEVLKAGTVLVGGIDTSAHITELERACLGRGLSLLMEAGVLGAENRRGLGKVRFLINDLPDPTPYDEWLSDNRKQIIQFLDDIGALIKKEAK